MNIQIGEPGRFELYHFAFSLCSQKVRLCLMEKGAGFLAHDINLQMPELGNYDPGYVRLRLAANPETKFATGYTGRSAVDSEGFDPAVVPTLVDHEAEKVVIDSLAICQYVDREVAPSGSLIPDDLAAAISQEMKIVDATPHVALLYGAHPEGDFRPKRIRNGMDGVHDRKIAKIQAARNLAHGDADLVAAYDAKIAKETAAKAFVASPDAMRAAVAEILTTVADLETRLADGREFVCGERLTMADLVWAISLFRLKWMGAGFAWQGGHGLNESQLPHVAAYAERQFARPKFRSVALDWPKVPHSEYVEEYYSG